MRTEAKEKYKVIRAIIEARKAQFQQDSNGEAVKACEMILNDLATWYEIEQALSGET